VDTICPSYIARTEKFPGAAARLAEEKKRKKYAFLQDRFLFVPVAVETLGVYSPEAKKFVEALGERLKAVTSEPRAGAFLKQRISLAIQRGNAAAILGSLPVGAGFKEIFNL
jgi:hypothetical protein